MTWENADGSAGERSSLGARTRISAKFVRDEPILKKKAPRQVA